MFLGSGVEFICSELGDPSLAMRLRPAWAEESSAEGFNRFSVSEDFSAKAHCLHRHRLRDQAGRILGNDLLNY